MVLAHPAAIDQFDHKWMETSLRQLVQEELANRLKKSRLMHGYSQSQVAASLHLSQSAISKYESGQVMPDLLVILTFCHLYGPELAVFFDCHSFERIWMGYHRLIYSKKIPTSTLCLSGFLILFG